MLNIASLIIGIVALVMAVFAFIPFLGIFNWLIAPLALIGAGVGAASGSKSGRNLNLVVLVVAIIRLWLGGGLL
jgi:hypothetical protein